MVAITSFVSFDVERRGRWPAGEPWNAGREVAPSRASAAMAAA
jgi:hypothetical protein